ncbi:MAG: hypothetical protein IKY33_00475 [Clostridia bacterium]|nr:hypothetical protein [Clostridia bacterium]
MENETLVNAGAEVTVEPQQTEGAAQTVDVATDTPDGAGQSKGQSKEENSAYAAMRRQYEAETSHLNERLSRLDSEAKKAGFENAEKLLLAHRAAEMGFDSAEELEAHERDEEEQRRQGILESEEYKTLASELQGYKDRESENALTQAMAADLAAVQKVFPEVKSLEELGAVYTASISAGIDAVTAARAAMAAKVKAPGDIGPVGTQTPPASDYFTEAEVEWYESHPKEVDKMSDAEFAKLRRSLSKIR